MREGGGRKGRGGGGVTVYDFFARFAGVGNSTDDGNGFWRFPFHWVRWDCEVLGRCIWVDLVIRCSVVA